ncbi:zinc-binding alcohol dehydrogenase family protein [Carbonactinospora thermoautotrophica]|uniref:zinc-binding alcohol dehydrogenase family protein n=1 Tax=Carbonactinospora thermoautotrophica TaxID=1469144 RepID=UPI003DA884E1
MMAWQVTKPGPLTTRPLRPVTRPVPEPGPGEVLIAVSVCAVCRTDLHLVEGDLPPRRPVAPLLCAGIIGYRALRRALLPPAGRLGIYGFGASAHLTAQVALAEGATVHVLTRSAQARRLALDLGAASAGSAYDRPPEPLDAAILFAPVGELVPVALEALDAGGTLAIAGIHLTDVPPLNYQRHLFRERTLRSVTANTRTDGQEFLDFAGRHRLVVVTTPYPLTAADQALGDLAADRVHGVAVLRVATDPSPDAVSPRG